VNERAGSAAAIHDNLGRSSISVNRTLRWCVMIATVPERLV
jgi:hypothetical protein